MNTGQVYCQFCSDLKKAKSHLNDATRIKNKLVEYTRHLKIVPDKTMVGMRHTHIHFMCGQCNKFHEQDLKRVETELFQIHGGLRKHKFEDPEEKKRVFSFAFELFRGYYPDLARQLYEELRKRP